MPSHLLHSNHTMSSANASGAAAPSSSRLCRESKKKALLIGINSQSAPALDYRLLKGPHQDVAEMKMLLVGTYAYREEDIQVLVDDGVPGHVQPDKRNIVSGSILTARFPWLTW